MATIQDFAIQSGFVFEAGVEQLGASTASGFPATSESAVVRITNIFKSPPALARYIGQVVTVQLKLPVTLKVGEQAVFFTHGMHYGEGLVVTEIGRAPAGDSSMNAQMESAAEAARSNELTQRLAQAELVISGVASEPVAFAAAEPAAGKRRVSEHDPDWGSAIITIDKVEKGSYNQPTKQIVFARSIDIVWYRAPKVKAGDRGVWILHSRDVRGKSVPALAIVHPLDFQPTSEIEHVRTLLTSSK
jgi:hypothetical protein